MEEIKVLFINKRSVQFFDAYGAEDALRATGELTKEGYHVLGFVLSDDSIRDDIPKDNLTKGMHICTYYTQLENGYDCKVHYSLDREQIADNIQKGTYVDSALFFTIDKVRDIKSLLGI